MILQRIQNERVQILHEVFVRNSHELLKKVVILVHRAKLADLLLDLFLGGIAPLICMLALFWRQSGEVNEFLVRFDGREGIEVGIDVFKLLGRLLK